MLKKKSYRFDEETADMLDRLTRHLKGPKGSRTALIAELIRERFHALAKEIDRAENKRQSK